MTAQLLQQLEIESLFCTPTAPVLSEAKCPGWSVAEYFAGIGLVRLGLEKAGWTVLFSNDIAKDKQQMYAAYFTDSSQHYCVSDIFDLSVEQIPQVLLATASFPCIDLSLAGNLEGLKGKYSSAFWGLIKILKQQGSDRPPLVLIENVPGWLNSNQGKDFRVTVKSLNALGYCCDVYAINASSFVPQSRERIFLLGIQKSLRPPVGYSSRERLYSRSSYLATRKLKSLILQNPDLDWTFLDVPSPPSKNIGLESVVEEISTTDARWWDDEKALHHLNMMDRSHLDRVYALAQQTQLSYRTLYRRRRRGMQRAEVRKDNIAGCLRTAKGGSSRQMLVQMGNGKIRLRSMTPREYARLQGVPDDYPILVNPIQAINGFGDAVCVPVMEWLAHAVLNPLAGSLVSSPIE